MGRLCDREKVDRPKVATRIRIRRRPIPPAPSTLARTTPVTGPISNNDSVTMATSISSRFYYDWPKKDSGSFIYYLIIHVGFSSSASLINLISFQTPLAMACLISFGPTDRPSCCYSQENVVSSSGRRSKNPLPPFLLLLLLLKKF